MERLIHSGRVELMTWTYAPNTSKRIVYVIPKAKGFLSAIQATEGIESYRYSNGVIIIQLSNGYTGSGVIEDLHDNVRFANFGIII